MAKKSAGKIKDIIMKPFQKLKDYNDRANQRGMQRLNDEINRNRDRYYENMYGPSLRKSNANKSRKYK